MPKKSPVKNSKMIFLGGGTIIALALLLVGAYGNSLKTQVGGPPQPVDLDYGPECDAARNQYNEASNRYSAACTPTILLNLPHTPSSQCYAALLELANAEDAVEEECSTPFAPPGPDDSFPPLPPIPYFIPPPNPFDIPTPSPEPFFPPGPEETLATVSPEPSTTPPASARPGV